MSRRLLIRALGTVAALGIPTALVVASMVLPFTPVTPQVTEPISVPVDTAPTDLVCPGVARVSTEIEGDDLVYDPQFDPTPVDSDVQLTAVSVDPPGVAALPGELRSLADGSVIGDVTPTGDVGALSLAGPEQGTVLHVDGAEAPAWVAASVVERTDAGDLRGLVGAVCRSPSSDMWLVGGATTLGSSARLVVQNPGDTSATVTVELWGTVGPVELAGAPQYLVPAGSERVILLEGTAAEQPRLVVHVTSAGGAVGAYLQDSQLRGLTPAGVDDVVPGVGPTTHQVLPGVSVVDSSIGGADSAVLRLLAPATEATADVTVLGPEGQTDLPGIDEVRLTAGSVIDVPLGGLPAGTWSLMVDADAPVVAAAMVTRGPGVGADEVDEEKPLERAWVASVEPGTQGPFALPEDVDWHLVLTSDESGDVTVEPVTAVLGDPKVVHVRGGTSVVLDATDFESETPLAALVVRSDAPVAWAVVLEVARDDGDFITVLSPAGVPDPRNAVLVRP